jgi:hypothetical protein
LVFHTSVSLTVTQIVPPGYRPHHPSLVSPHNISHPASPVGTNYFSEVHGASRNVGCSLLVGVPYVGIIDNNANRSSRSPTTSPSLVSSPISHPASPVGTNYFSEVPGASHDVGCSLPVGVPYVGIIDDYANRSSGSPTTSPSLVSSPNFTPASPLGTNYCSEVHGASRNVGCSLLVGVPYVGIIDDNANRSSGSPTTSPSLVSSPISHPASPVGTNYFSEVHSASRDVYLKMIVGNILRLTDHITLNGVFSKFRTPQVL